jgi:predicted metal-dependent enzyme (double-stranded beta helix superfamily)
MESTLALLDQAATLSPALALRECTPLLPLLVPHLAQRIALAAKPAVGASPVFDTIAKTDGWSLELFRWPRGARTPIHDHTSWGIYVCLAGQLGEERYVRIDDGAQLSVARLRSEWRTVWRVNEQSTLMPYDGGIHRVRSAGLSTAVSLHLYGPRFSSMDGRDYDPRRDFVCDRPLAA